MGAIQNNNSNDIGKSFSEFMKGFGELPYEKMFENTWEMRDGHYVQFSLYSDMGRSVAETNETFSARL